MNMHVGINEVTENYVMNLARYVHIFIYIYIYICKYVYVYIWPCTWAFIKSQNIV